MQHSVDVDDKVSSTVERTGLILNIGGGGGGRGNFE